VIGPEGFTGRPGRPLRESDYLIAWLAFFGVATVLGGLVGGIFGLVVGSVLGALGIETSTAITVMKAWVYVLAIPVSYGCFRLIVGSLVVRKVLRRLSNPAHPVAPTADEPPTGAPSAFSPALATQKEPVASRHSGLGALSITLAGVAFALYATCIVYMVATDFSETEVIYSGVGIAFSSCLGFFALGTGIGSLFQAGRKRHLAIIGTITSASLVAVLALTWTIAVIAIVTLA